jgi:hypothetical protein
MSLVLPTFGAVALAALEETTEQRGMFDRAFSGKARSEYEAAGRAWVCQTAEYTHAEAHSIRSELLGTPPITVTLLGSSVAVHPRNIRVLYPAPLLATVAFELHQQAPV